MNLHISKELPRITAVILAGGQGERLHPLTVSRPKPAVSFGGSLRIIDFTLSNCFHSGVSNVSVLTQYRYQELHHYIRRGWSELWNNESQESRLLCLPAVNGKRYRGTADAVFRNMELLQSDHSDYVLILSGDHIYHMDYRDLIRHHMEKQADLTIATVEHPVKDASQFGVVEVDNNFRVTGFTEKPAHPVPLPSRPSMALISMGVYVFRKEVLLETLRSHCEQGRGFDFGHNVIPSMIPSGRTYAYDFRDEISDAPRYWRDIGTLDAYYRASMDLVGADAAFDPFANDGQPAQPTRHPGGLEQATQHHSSRVSNSVVSPDVHVAEDAMIEDSILMPGVRIGKGVRLRRAIVEEGVHIPAGAAAGFDSDRDRACHTVTSGGVVVINRVPLNRTPAALHFVLEPTRQKPTGIGLTA